MRFGKFWIMGLGLALAAGLLLPLRAEAARKDQTIYASNSYVSMSPDGKAFTVGLGVKGTAGLSYSSARDLKVTVFGKMDFPAEPAGQHYYTDLVHGSVPVGYWRLDHPFASCVHSGNPTKFGLNKIGAIARTCGKHYPPGWIPFCAYCGEAIGDGFFYLDREMARSLRYLESGSEYSNYFYLCPESYTIEQTIHTNHRCKVLSCNRYRVCYHPSARDVTGYMQTDSFFYDNNTLYEGKTVTPSLNLSVNRYAREGYVFAGWSTTEGGSVLFADGQDWLTVQRNLHPERLENDGVLNLYAVWKPVSSGLLVRPNGGTFQGKTADTLLERGYGAEVSLGTVKFPDLKVTFRGNGAAEFQTKTAFSRRTFTEWKKSSSFSGSYDREKKTYTFSSTRKGTRDTLTAAWTAEAVTLPAVTRKGYVLEGWYETRNGKQLYAGGPGDRYVPDRDVTLQAVWTSVDLILESEAVYDKSVNQGKGAVNLSWGLAVDRNDVSYILYRQKAGQGREVIHSAGEFTGEETVSRVFENADRTERFEIPSDGRYEITLTGASGGSHGEKSGGAGGKVDLVLWLTKGQVLTVEAGKAGSDVSETSPATGGGATRLYLKDGNAEPVLLAVAGGGGGANECFDGGAGGSSEALREREAAGESAKATEEIVKEGDRRKVYASGGGDGFVGGVAGSVTYRGHTHNQELCGYHTHTGSTETGEGCYGERHEEPHVHDENCAQRPVNYCGGLHWDDAQGKYVRGFCPNCGKDESGGCPASDGKCVHLTEYACGNPVKVTYSMNCGIAEGWQCGKDDTVMERSSYLSDTRPSGGGSNYVSSYWTERCRILYRAYDATENYGVNVGNGKMTLFSKSTGYRTDRSMKGVTASDEAAPLRISRSDSAAAGAGKVQITWEEPEDRGTEYRFLAECYEMLSGDLLATSKERSHTMITGIAGYYVLTDESPQTQAGPGRGTFRSGRTFMASAREKTTVYVHIAAADKAGNVGESIHIEIKPDDEEILWDVVTRKVSLKEAAYVHNAGNGDFYIRADGKNPLTFTMEAELKGPARKTYQVQKVTLEERETGAGHETTVPYSDPAGKNVSYEAGSLGLASGGKTVLQTGNVASAERTDSARKVRVVRELLPRAMREGEILRVFPTATAVESSTGKEMGSVRSADLNNGIRLISDVTPPVISGIQQAQSLGKTIDREKTPSAVVSFTAADSGSGVDPNEFYVTITNLDNRITRKIEAKDGRIRVELADSKDLLLSGDLTLTVHAADRVGNVTEETVSFTEFDLKTSVTRVLEAKDGVSTFKRGESGILHITVTGYADSVEVTFPKGLTDVEPTLNHTFDYSDCPEFEQKEDYVFMIPLYPLMKEKDSFEISVTARKGNLVLTSRPRVHILELDGTVLDEIVTSLR